MLPALNIPGFGADIVPGSGGDMIFDFLRRQYVRLTPEEWVRQHFLHFLVEHRAFPPSLIAVESGFLFQGMPRRVDALAFDRNGKALLAVECKAPDVALNQNTFDQIGRYNTVLQAPFLAVTNGLTHACIRVDHQAHSLRFLEDLPSYSDLLAP